MGTLLQPCFDIRLISKTVWPFCSPDMTPLDLFLWGYLRLAIHLSQNMQKRPRNTKNEKCMTGYFVSLHFFRVSHPFFHNSHHGWHSCKKSKNFVVYFFVALIKHKIHMKYEKCIVSVSYFVVCLAKTLAKCEKCIASLKDKVSRALSNCEDHRLGLLKKFESLLLKHYEKCSEV